MIRDVIFLFCLRLKLPPEISRSSFCYTASIWPISTRQFTVNRLCCYFYYIARRRAFQLLLAYDVETNCGIMRELFTSEEILFTSIWLGRIKSKDIQEKHILFIDDIWNRYCNYRCDSTIVVCFSFVTKVHIHNSIDVNKIFKLTFTFSLNIPRCIIRIFK